MATYEELMKNMQKAYSNSPDVFTKAMLLSNIAGGVGGAVIGANKFEEHPIIGTGIGANVGAAVTSLPGIAIAYNITKRTL